MSAPIPAGDDEPGGADRLTGLGERARRLVDSIVATVAALTDPGHPVDAALDGAFATALDTYRAAIAIRAATDLTDLGNAAARGQADAALNGLDILANAYSARAAGGPASADLRSYLDSQIRALRSVDRPALLVERGYPELPVSPATQQALADADSANYRHVALAICDHLTAISVATTAPIRVVSTDGEARVVAEHAAAGPFLAADGTAAHWPRPAHGGHPLGVVLAGSPAVTFDPKEWLR